MKKYFTLMMSLFMAFAFTACSEDEGGDEGKKTVTSADVAGTYSGSLEVTLGESEPIVSEGTITVSAVAITESVSLWKISNCSRPEALLSMWVTSL